MKLDQTGSFATAVSQDGPSASAFFLQYSGQDDTRSPSPPSRGAPSPMPPPRSASGTTSSACTTRDRHYTLYVDGTGAAGRVAPVPRRRRRPGRSRSAAAKFGGNTVDFWPGALDQVHVWDRALTPADVAALYHSGQ